MNTKMIRAAALMLAASVVSPLSAAEFVLPKEGWTSWKVDAVEGSPAWCCWNNRPNEFTKCDLDDERFGYGSKDGAKTDSIRIYARTSGGKLASIRALAASCPVESKAPVQELENIATDDSARWTLSVHKQLRDTPTSRHDLDEQALAALAMHRGKVAFDALSAMARGDAEVEYRKRAIFWVAMLRGQPGADLTSNAMFNDKDPEVRKHAAFAITQSKSPRIAAELIKQGTTDHDSDVRQQAWFWLAQSGVPNSEEPLLAAAKNDQDDSVREHAIFALSQLPDDRSTKALVAAAQDRTLSAEQRKKALFWLAQSDSPEAASYLDGILTRQNSR